jgi:hypothetical protein
MQSHCGFHLNLLSMAWGVAPRPCWGEREGGGHVPPPPPSAPGPPGEVAVRWNMCPLPVPPLGRDRGEGKRPPLSPPGEVTADRRRMSQRVQPGHAHAARHGGRIEGSEDPTRAHWARGAERRGTDRAPGRDLPATAPCARREERRLLSPGTCCSARSRSSLAQSRLEWNSA